MKKSFEEQMIALEKIINELENGNLNLDEKKEENFEAE